MNFFITDQNITEVVTIFLHDDDDDEFLLWYGWPTKGV